MRRGGGAYASGDEGMGNELTEPEGSMQTRAPPSRPKRTKNSKWNGKRSRHQRDGGAKHEQLLPRPSNHETPSPSRPVINARYLQSFHSQY